MTLLQYVYFANWKYDHMLDAVSRKLIVFGSALISMSFLIFSFAVGFGYQKIWIASIGLMIFSFLGLMLFFARMYYVNGLLSQYRPLVIDEIIAQSIKPSNFIELETCQHLHTLGIDDPYASEERIKMLTENWQWSIIQIEIKNLMLALDLMKFAKRINI